MTLTLAIDTSADVCSAALLGGNEVLAVNSKKLIHGHAVALIPMICNLAEIAQVSLSDIGLIGVSIGPGSFTGIRTGIAAAQGFSLVTECPVVGISSFAMVAADALRKRPSIFNTCPVLCVLETRRQDFFAEVFDHFVRSIVSPCVADKDQVIALLKNLRATLAGNAIQRLNIGARERPFITDSWPNSEIIGELAIQKFSGPVSSLDQLVPLYLRKESVTRSR